MVENKFSLKQKVIKSDRGGEYIGNKVAQFLRQQGIQEKKEKIAHVLKWLDPC